MKLTCLCHKHMSLPFASRGRSRKCKVHACNCQLHAAAKPSEEDMNLLLALGASWKVYLLPVQTKPDLKSGGGGRLRGIIDTVIGNLQLSITNVHIRFEVRCTWTFSVKLVVRIETDQGS